MSSSDKIYSVVYISQLKLNLTVEQLINIFSTAVENNSKQLITGILFYNQYYFLQILEGNKDKVCALVTKIHADIRHNSIKILGEGFILKRNFSNWNMEIKYIPEKIKNNNSNTVEDMANVLLYILKQLGFSTGRERVYQLFNITLTNREQNIFDKLAEGLTVEQISKSLIISAKTVARHVENIKEKLEVDSKHALLVKIFRSGYLNCNYSNKLLDTF